MAKLNFKILKNMPSRNSYGQYYYNSEGIIDFYEGSGTGTPFTNDDLYTIITQKEYLNDNNEDTVTHFRPIVNAVIGDVQTAIVNEDVGTYVQKYYPIGSDEYLTTSAPNNVNLYFELTTDDNSFDIESLNYYSDLGGTATDIISVKIINWDWQEGDYIPTDFIDAEPIDVINFYEDDNQTPNFITHQYNSSGLKIIKGVIWVTDVSGNPTYYQQFETRIFLGLDGIFVEDFMDIGGPDFTYLPWPLTSPIIGGVSEESKYIKSVRSIVNSNQFLESESFEKYYAHKAYQNNETGESLGDTDIEQVRVFNTGYLDLNWLLGIDVVQGNNLYSYDHENWSCSTWDESRYDCFPEESSIGSLFIDEALDPGTQMQQTLMDTCLFEFNCGNVAITHIIDTSGNGNKGILIGDYRIKKDTKGVKSMRDTMMKISKKATKNGAI